MQWVKINVMHTVLDIKNNILAKDPFTILTVMHAIACFHKSAGGIIQRYHFYDRREYDGAYDSAWFPEFNCVELSRSARQHMSLCDAVKTVNRP